MVQLLIKDIVPFLQTHFEALNSGKKKFNVFKKILECFGYASHDSDIMQFFTMIGDDFDAFTDRSKYPRSWNFGSTKTNIATINLAIDCEQVKTAIGELYEKVKHNVNRFQQELRRQMEETPVEVPLQQVTAVNNTDLDERDDDISQNDDIPSQDDDDASQATTESREIVVDDFEDLYCQLEKVLKEKEEWKSKYESEHKKLVYYMSRVKISDDAVMSQMVSYKRLMDTISLQDNEVNNW